MSKSICLMMLIAALHAVHREAFAAADPAELDALIVQLGAESWQERESAQQRLVMLGNDARARLEALARESDDQEVGLRAESALAQIIENEQIGPSIITIRGEQMPLQEVFKQLSEQANASIEPYPPEILEHHQQVRVDLEIDHLPFWEAMRQITEKTGFVVQAVDNTGMRLMHGGAGADGMSVVSGAFQVSAVRVSRSRSVELGRNRNTHDDFSVQLHARAEPKLRPLQVSHVPRLLEAVDEHGNSLMPSAEMQHAHTRFGHSGVWQMSARLSAPPNMGRTIAIFKGTIDVSLRTRGERIEVSDILSARNISKVAGGLNFVIKELRSNGESYTLQISVRSETAHPDQWMRIQHLLSSAELKLLDENGEAFQRSSYSTSGGQNQMDMTIEFNARDVPRRQKLTEPSKLVWTVPTATKEISVPFEFRDLPIP